MRNPSSSLLVPIIRGADALSEGMAFTIESSVSKLIKHLTDKDRTAQLTRSIEDKNC